MQIIEAHSDEQVAAVRHLFVEYARSLNIDLCFQGFEQELAELPGRYAPPSGRLLLALESEEEAGCVGLRKIDKGICEMKRLYVRTAYRGRGAGRLLVTAVLEAARQSGYRMMRLDTLVSMKEARALYETFGFVRIAPYYENPSAETVFMELDLLQNSKRQNPSTLRGTSKLQQPGSRETSKSKSQKGNRA